MSEALQASAFNTVFSIGVLLAMIAASFLVIGIVEEIDRRRQKRKRRAP